MLVFDTSDNELREINTFSVDEKLMTKGENELLKSSVIFGSNASGKSNVLKILTYMRNVISSSASVWPIVQANEPFAFRQNADSEESLFEVEIIQNNTFYRYGFTILHGTINREWLDRRTERLTSVFKREGKTLEITGLNKQATNLINISPTTLFISVANNFHLDIAPYITDVMTWFRNLMIVFSNNANSLDIYTVNNGKYRKEALCRFIYKDEHISDLLLLHQFYI